MLGTNLPDAALLANLTLTPGSYNTSKEAANLHSFDHFNGRLTFSTGFPPIYLRKVTLCCAKHLQYSNNAQFLQKSSDCRLFISLRKNPLKRIYAKISNGLCTMASILLHLICLSDQSEEVQKLI
jgi:hypothetical protein